TRRTAWMTAGILLTLPMFVLSGKFVHGDIWLIFAVAVPTLLYLMACYASTRRMHRAMLSLSALSVTLSFLSGGLFALAILACTGLLMVALVWRNPDRKYILRPMLTRFFLVPLYVSFVISGCIFGVYVSNIRYEQEDRVPMTLNEINDALDEDRVIRIERRHNQIIGEMRATGEQQNGEMSFILVESHDNLSTDSQEIFKLNESEKRAFETYLMVRFQKKMPSRAAVEVPPLEDAFKEAVRFFWYHTNEAYEQSSMTLARVVNSVIEAEPRLALIRKEPVANDMPAFETVLEYAETALDTTWRLHPDELVRVLNDKGNSDWIEIETGNGYHGFVARKTVRMDRERHRIRWTSWLDVLLFGLFPWGCFFPFMLVCAFVSPSRLSIARTPFRGEFDFQFVETNNPHRSPIQSILVSWLIVSVVALFVGINNSRHDSFAGVIPLAILAAISLTSSRFWRAIRESLEARIGLILLAFVCLGVAIAEFHYEPFRLVRYMLTDPPMHWDSENISVFDNYLENIVFFSVLFGILTLLSFTGAADALQKKILAWREVHKRPAVDARTSSSTTLKKVSRGENEPMPYAPAFSMMIIAAFSACFIYFTYTPSISDNFTENSLIQSYFEHASQSEPVFLLTGENSQLCLTWHDCEPGYVCQSSRCRISTFSSYSLNVAKSVTRQDMIRDLIESDQPQPGFYIVPRDAFFNINQTYRALSTPENRHNLRALDAPSSRLYLIANHLDEAVSPLDKLLPEQLPDDVSKSNIQVADGIEVVGVRPEKLDFSKAKMLELTVFYRVSKPIESNMEFRFTVTIGSRLIDFTRPLLPNRYDPHRLISGDLVARRIRLDLPAMPSHGVMDIAIGAALSDVQESEQFHLTTIDFR
ncbi:MAG: hypothetical protein IJU23_07790, partial [Proteobacteria bacterium]|nr:hypothetical protein [Pseudomonadota bacterium]